MAFASPSKYPVGACDVAGPAPRQQPSPPTPQPKHVAFELLLNGSSKIRARIPMRVQIFPHDTTDSIVTTVKNFYGIYEGSSSGSGVSFEDENGTTLIARYENLRNNMTVYVRVIPGPEESPEQKAKKEESTQPSLASPYYGNSNGGHVKQEYKRSPSRSASRASRRRSVSPAAGQGRHGLSRSTGRAKSRASSTHGTYHDDAINDLSDHSSSTTSRRPRFEQMPSSDISKDNILQDSRRKRPKFDSSELPLFAPPQVPLAASQSSVSPQHRPIPGNGTSPFARPQPTYAQQPFPSPQSFGHHDSAYGLQTPVQTSYAAQNGAQMRSRQMAGAFGMTQPGNNILPTPDPTIASCISDEDVALQLIRLGDASNFSHGRTSASTFDDNFSGAADAASSTGVSASGSDVSDAEDGMNQRESSPLLPPGVVKKHHKKLDEILPSCESSELSSDEMDRQEFVTTNAVNGPDGAQRTLSVVRNGYAKSEAMMSGDNAPRRNKRAKSATTKKSAGKASGSRKSKQSFSGPVGSATMAAMSAPANAAPSASVPSAAPFANNQHVFAVPPPPQQILSPTAPRKPSAASMSAPTYPATSVNSAASQHPHPAHSHVKLAPPHPTNRAPTAAAQAIANLGPDEEDLSTKPRCQRCRKSKKGCDRQRPCQRCKDAGIGIEGCISEDEGNGRKGRYGRHMGVPVKKAEMAAANGESILAVAAGTGGPGAEKAKKRKS